MNKLVQFLQGTRKKEPSANRLYPPEEFFHSLYSIVGLDQLLDNLSSRLMEQLGARALTVVLYEPITNRYCGKRARGDHQQRLPDFNFSPADKLVKWLNVNRAPLNIQNDAGVFQYLSRSERRLIEETRTALVLPFIVVNRLTGALFVGERESGVPYRRAEIDLLSMVTAQSALAIEHALMSQFQEEKLRKLFRADSLATVGELAAGAAHEIRNPLTSIRSTIQYLQKDVPVEKQPLMQGILEEVDRIDQIINGLLSFSRSSELHVVTIDVAEMLDQTLMLLESEFRKHSIEIGKEYPAEPLFINGDASKLKQVFLNVLMNSIQATPDGGTIRLSTSVPNPRSGMVDVIIRDNGCGIPPEHLARVFDPFYTTKENGTGLGLSISFGIVSKHGGDIEIRSSQDSGHSGTSVTVRLPRNETPDTTDGRNPNAQ